MKRLILRLVRRLIVPVIVLLAYMKRDKVIIWSITFNQQVNSIYKDSNVYNDFSTDFLTNTSVSRRFALMSLSAVDNRTFHHALYVPVCALAWRRLNYEPLVMILANNKSDLNKLTRRVVRSLEYLNVRVFYVPVARKRSRSELSFLGRLFGGILPDSIVRDDDFIVTTDTDLIPISREYFSLINTRAITILDAKWKYFTHREKFHNLPESLGSYIGMIKSQWRDVMRLTLRDQLTGFTIAKKSKQIYGGIKKTEKLEDRLDQQVITLAMSEYTKSSPVKVNRRVLVGLRIDKGVKLLWNGMLSKFDQVTDAHLFHSDSFEHRSKLFKLFNKLFSSNINQYLVTYMDDFYETMVS